MPPSLKRNEIDQRFADQESGRCAEQLGGSAVRFVDDGLRVGDDVPVGCKFKEILVTAPFDLGFVLGRGQRFILQTKLLLDGAPGQVRLRLGVQAGDGTGIGRQAGGDQGAART